MSAFFAYLFGRRGQQPKAITNSGEKGEEGNPKKRYEENVAELKRRIAAVRQHRDSRLAAARQKVLHQDPEIRDKILALPMTKLRDALQCGEFTALTVLKAFAWRALSVNDELNCLCDFLLGAFDEAAELDRCYPPGSKKPPLFGLPFSVKLGNEMPGCEWNVGVATFIGNPVARHESTTVAQLRALGAIPFVITNASHFLMLHFTMNPVYGWTGNPLDPTKMCGGSSGGEAALKAAGGCAFGIGNDCGGSLRIPSTMCGTATLKPTKGRYDVHWLHNGVNGCRAISGAAGFITTEVADLIDLWQSVLPKKDEKTGDCERILSGMAPLPLDLGRINAIASGTRKLRIGYYTDDGYHATIPAFRRGVREVVEKLRAAGHTLVPFTIPGDIERVVLLILRLFMVAGYSTEAYKWGEPYVFSESIPPGAGPNPCPPFTSKYPAPGSEENISSSADGNGGQQWGGFFWGWTQWMFQRWTMMNGANGGEGPKEASSNDGKGADRTGCRMDDCGATSIEVYRRYQCEMEDYIVEFYNNWRRLKLDAVIGPSWYHGAVEHRFSDPLIKEYASFITGLYNMVNYPVGIPPPVSFVTAEDDAELQDDRRWPTEGKYYAEVLREACKQSRGLPITVQVIGASYEEEVVLGLMSLIEKLTVENRQKQQNTQGIEKCKTIETAKRI